MPYVHQPRKRSIASISVGASGGSVTSGFGSRRSGGSALAGLVQSPSERAGIPSAQAGVPSSQARGFPERIEADVMGFVQTAAMAPGHALERPLSVANTLTGWATGAKPGDPGPLGGILDTLGSIGFGEANVGNLLGAVGEGIMRVGDAPIAAMNSNDARMLVKYADASDDTEMDEFFAYKKDGPPILGAFGIGGRNMTVGEFKQNLRDRGFFSEINYGDGTTTELSYEEAVQKARENQFGFGSAMVNDSSLVDIAARIGLDPFNVLLGAGVIGKAAKVASWAASPVTRSAQYAGSRLRPAWGVGYMADMAQAGIRATRMPSAIASAQAFRNGNVAQTTLRGLGRALAVPRALVLPGTGSLPRRYARGALRLELGLLGVELGAGAVDAAATGVLGEDNVISGFMEPIHDASQAMLADKPMSQDVTFMMVSAFAMPAVPLLREDAGAVAGRARESFGDQDLFLWSQRYGTDDTGVGTMRDPMGTRRGKAKERTFLEALGGKLGFAKLIDHIDMRIAFQRIASYSPLVKHFESFDEAMARSRAIGHVVATEAARMRAQGKIGARDRLAAFEEWGRAHSRTIIDKDGNMIRDMPERVDFELSPAALIDQWKRYVEVHDALRARFEPVGEAIVGRSRRLTQEDLQAVRAAIASAADGGKVDAQYVRDLLLEYSGMFEDPTMGMDAREFWTSIMSLGSGADGQYGGGGKLDAALLQSHVDSLIKQAPTARELFHEARAAEQAAPADPSRAGGGPIQNGRIRKIYSTRKLNELRVESNAEIRSIQKELDVDVVRLEKKWTKKGRLRITRGRVVRPTKPEVSPMGGIDDLRRVASAYNETAGMKPLREREYWPADPDFGRRTGLAYETLPAVDDSPATRLAYEAFERETIAQYRALTDAGYRIEAWDSGAQGKEQPYASSEEMQADVRDNKHLWFFTGGDPHPFLGTPLADFNGWTANDIFRAVHDIMTHAQEGYQFGARGELNAAIKHSQMYSPIARRAMLTETHGQNSWVNHGPHNPSALAPEARPYAQQKAALLPDEIIQEFEGRFIGETEAVAARKAREAVEALGLTGDQGNVVAALLEARARAWASAKPGRTASEYLGRFKFERGGEPKLEALFQGMIRARTTLNAFATKRGPQEGSKLARRLAHAARRASKKRDGILPAPGTAAARRKALEILPDTEEFRWMRETALRETLSPEGPGPWAQEYDELIDVFYRAVYREQQRQLRGQGYLDDDVLFQAGVETRDPRTLTREWADEFSNLEDPKYAQLKEVIAREGMDQPIEIHTDGTIRDGHHRHKIAVELGMDEVPVIVSDKRLERQPQAWAYDHQTGEWVKRPSPETLYQTQELIDEPVPAVLADNGFGDASPLETVELPDGTMFGIPGGVAGLTDGSLFSLWDLHRIKAQGIDPNLVPDEIRIPFYKKMLGSQVRGYADPVDVFNRTVFAVLSPQMPLHQNEALVALTRAMDLDGIKRLAALGDGVSIEEAGRRLIEEHGLRAAGGPLTARMAGSVVFNARRFAENPDWFKIRDGEDLLEYADRVQAVMYGGAMKVGTFAPMLGDPLSFPRGTMDTHMVQRLVDEGYVTPEEVASLRVGNGYKAAEGKRVAYRRGPRHNNDVHPDVPAHLRDLPWDPPPGQLTVYGKTYELLNEALKRKLKDEGVGIQVGGYQWMEWDLQRKRIEPHTLVYPGAYRLPHMTDVDVAKSMKVYGEAGWNKRGSAVGGPMSPTEALLFQDNAKGATEFLEDGDVIIRGLNSPDMSTFIHEVGHVFRRDLDDQDLALAEAHYGVTDGVWAREAEEAFARDFERWTRNGAQGAPAQLQGIFAQVYEWMRQIYRTVLKRDVHPDMGDLFSRMFKDRERDPFDITEAQDTGPANSVQIAGDELIGSTRRVLLAKYADDGKLAARLIIDFDPATGTAAKDGLDIFTNPEYRGKGYASDLYAFAEQQGWEVEQASARSEGLTPEGRAFQQARWDRQRRLEQAAIENKRARAREVRRQVKEIHKRASELRTVRVDPSFLDQNGNPTVDPDTLQQIREQTAFVQDTFPEAYGIEKAPKVSYARYEPEDSHLAALLTERSNIAQVLFDYGPLGKMTQFITWITSPLKASTMAHDSRQQVFNQLLPLGAKPSEVSEFLNRLRGEQDQGWTITKMQQPLFRGITAIPPNRISRIAAEVFSSNEGFVKRFTDKHGGLDRMHVALDEAHNSLVRKIDLKQLRGQKVGKLERIFRSGYWAWQHLPGLRTASDTSRMVSKVFYPIFRFQMDIRWQALNMIEADIMAFFRDGIDGTRFSGQRDTVVRRGGRDVNISQNAVDFHGEASGMPMVGKKGMGREGAYEDTGVFLTNQNLAPVLRRSFDIHRIESTDAVLNDMAATDPVVQLLERKYGKERGTWAEQINETLYSFDRRGVRNTVDEAVRRVRKYEKWSQAEYDQMVPLINKLVERNQQAFDDLIQIHVGNINRSRLERTMNSFWLYWPISYQIKATKWLAGVLTDRAFGSQTNLGGLWSLDRFAESMRDRMEIPEFQEAMEENEDWWFAASMLLPMSPWDMGVSLNRHVRYVGGNVLGLWPEYAGLDTPGDYARKALEMGPIYTADLWDRLFTSDETSSDGGPSATSIAP